MNIIKYITIVLCAIFTLSSCTKDESNTLFDYDPSVLSSVAIFNTVSNSSNVTVSVGHQKRERTMVAFNDQFGFGKYIAYKNWFAGNFDLFIDNQNSGKNESEYKNVNFQAGKFYSLFVYKAGDLKSLLKEDNIIRPSEGKAKIRIANFNQEMSSVSVYLSDVEAPFFRNVKFTSVSDFIEIDIEKVRGFVIRTDNGITELNLVKEQGLDNRGIYTILLKGSLSNGEDVGYQDLISIIKQS